MYCLTDKQIDYILNDISARGVEMEGLQLNLLDHVCCIIEQNLEENGDFEDFYQKTIRTFYKEALWEIEEETLFLLTYKNYYTMKKTMIISGTFSATSMSLGILFKFMHWPGASVLILLGIVACSLVFLPLFFTVKVKEQQSMKDQLIIGLGVLSGILMSLSVLFKVQHWPYANKMAILSLIILGLIFLPIYFFSGIRDAEKKVNTITVSILIIMICGLWLTLIRSPRSSTMVDIRDTYSFLTTEQIVEREQQFLQEHLVNDSLPPSSTLLGQKIVETCRGLKEIVLEWATGHKKIAPDFEEKKMLLSDLQGVDPFSDSTSFAKMSSLMRLVDEYNALIDKKGDSHLKKIPTHASCIEYYKTHEYGLLNVMGILSQLSHVQLFVLQNEQELLAQK